VYAKATAHEGTGQSEIINAVVHQQWIFSLKENGGKDGKEE
jgi:hypothetical protein